MRAAAVGRGGLKGEFVQGPAREEGGEDGVVFLAAGRVAGIGILGGGIVVVRKSIARDRGLGVTRDGFEDVVGVAVDGAAEEFVVGAPADAEFGGAGPGFVVGGVWGGGGGDGGGGAVGEEGGVGGDVGDEVVDGGGAVGEDGGGAEGLDGGEGVGDEGAGCCFGGRVGNWFSREGEVGGFGVEGGGGAGEKETGRCFHGDSLNEGLLIGFH